MNNYGILLNEIPYDLKRKFRYLEKNSKKVNNVEWSIVFNETLTELYTGKHSQFQSNTWQIYSCFSNIIGIDWHQLNKMTLENCVLISI